MDAGFYKDALSSLEMSVRHGCEFQCYRMMIDAHLELKQPDAAEKIFNRNIKDRSTDSARYQAAMIDYLRNNDADRALQRFKAINHDRARDKTMMIRLRSAQFETIASMYSESSDYTQFELLGYAYAYYRLNEYDKAEDALQSLRHKQTSQLLTQRKIQAVEFLVRIKIAKGQFTAAKAIYHAFMENNKDTVYAKYRNAIDNLRKAKFDDVINEIDSLYSQNPESTEILRLVALAEFGNKNYQSVIDRLENFSTHLEKHSRMLLAASYNNLGRPYEAIKLYDGQLTDDLDEFEIARAHAMLGSESEAAEISKNIDLSPYSADFNHKLVRLWFELKKYDRVVRSVSAVSNDEIPLDLLVIESYLRLNREEDARSYAASYKKPATRHKLLAYLEARMSNMNEAIDHYKELVKIESDKKNLQQLAGLYANLGQFDKSLEAIKTGFQLGGSNTKLIGQAVNILKKKSHQAVIEWLDSIPEGSLDYIEVQIQLARHEISLGDQEGAVKRLRPLVYENNREATYLMAIARQNSDPDESIRLMEELLSKKFSMNVALFLHQKYINTNFASDLRRIIRQIESEAGINVKTAKLLSEGYQRLGDYGALGTLADEIDSQGFRAMALEIRGDISLAKGELSQARLQYLESLKLKKADVTYVKYFGTRIENQPAGQKRTYDQMEAVLEKHPDFDLLRRYLGTRLINVDDEAAIRHLRILIELFPLDAALLNNLAWASLDHHPYEALDYSRKAFELEPDSFEILDTHVRALVSNDMKSEAKAVLVKQIERFPNDKNLMELLEWVG